MVDTWTLRRVLGWIQTDLSRRGVDSARLDADLLVARALGLTRIALYLDLDRPLVPAELASIRALVERRRRREPVAYILGEREFYGRPFAVTSEVLIPRPDTETLVERALAHLTDDRPGPVIDVCTGSGAIALTLAAERRSRQFVASDVSPGALEVARKNAEKHGLLERVDLRLGDLFSVVREGERFACVTINPPYIASDELLELEPDVRDFEPRLALDAGADALSFYRRIVQSAPAALAPGGVLLVEVGVDQASRVAALMRNAGFVHVSTHKDLAGIERVVEGQTAAG